MFYRARAPLRVSFIGGGTDLPSYYTQHGGAVLTSTISRYAHVTVSPRDDGVISLFSVDFGRAVNYRLDEKPFHDEALKLAVAAVDRFREHGKLMSGIDVRIQTDAPAGSGLGGSAAVTVALLSALKQLLGIALTKYELAELAYTVERLDLKISGGKQDQYQVAFGGFNLIEFADDRILVTPLRLDSDIVYDLEYHCLLCYTGKTHTSARIIDGLERYIREGRPETMEGLRETYGLVYQMKEALLLGDLSRFAEILDHAWQVKMKLNLPQVTNSFIDEMYELARHHGALGGKLLGAGAGGYLLLFCEGDKKRQVREQLQRAGGQFMEFSFVNEGVVTWLGTCP